MCLLLAGSILVVFYPVLGHDFLTFEDSVYVTKNAYVKQGLTWEGFRWALTTWHAEFWHPLTWLSHMLDVQLFGLDAGMHLGTNLLLHMANSVLLLLLLHRMTGRLGRSAFASALFAIHPLHVESVAWVAERKDLVSTFFALLTLGAYVRYTVHRGVLRYLAVLVLFTLSLASKSMVVTLPFVMILLDVWPLDRMGKGEGGPPGWGKGGGGHSCF